MADNLPALPPDFKTRVTDHVKATMFQLLPDDKFEELVRSEMEAFFQGQGVDFIWDREQVAPGWSYRDVVISKTAVTPFRKMVWDAVRPMIEAKFDAMLKADKFAKVATYVEQTDKWAARKLKLADDMDELVERTLAQVAMMQQRAMFDAAVQQAASLAEAVTTGMIRNSVVQAVDQYGNILPFSSGKLLPPDSQRVFKNPNGSGFIDELGNPVYN